MSKLGKVGVLMGGKSAERDVSFMSGNGVLQALRDEGVDAHAFDVGTQPLGELERAGFDRVFIALHGRYGEDGAIQGALELMGIPYTGSSVLASAICMDKITTKRLWIADGLPTPRHAVVTPQTDFAQLINTLGQSLIYKAAHEGSTIGIYKCNSADPQEHRKAFEQSAAYDSNVLVEQFIIGRELTCAVLGQGTTAKALPLIEIIAPGGEYDYQNKYFTDDTRYDCPAQIDAALTAKIQDLAERAYRCVGCEGWGRVDFMLRSADMEPYLIEVNTSPGMTGHSLVPMAAKASGMSYGKLCVHILEGASLKNETRPLKA